MPITPVPGKPNVWELKSSCGIILDLSCREWCVLFDVLFNQHEDLPFAIFGGSPMLSSVPRPVQPMREGRRDMKSWRVECSHQGISAGWDITGALGGISYTCNLLTPKFTSSRIQILLYEFPDDLWNREPSRRGKGTSSASAGAAGIFSGVLGHSTSGPDARNSFACLSCVVVLYPARRRIAYVALSLWIF
jgi:hypothetical protein